MGGLLLLLRGRLRGIGDGLDDSDGRCEPSIGTTSNKRRSNSRIIIVVVVVNVLMLVGTGTGLHYVA